MKIYLILGLITIGIIFVISYFLYWAVFQGQFDDIEDQADAILLDDDRTAHLVDEESQQKNSDGSI